MYPMHPDDIRDEEARFFGPHNEFQAAYEISQLTTPQRRVDHRMIDQLKRCGYHVLTMRTTRFCRYTDATLPGYDEGLVDVFLTYDDADREAQRLHDDGLSDCDFKII